MAVLQPLNPDLDCSPLRRLTEPCAEAELRQDKDPPPSTSRPLVQKDGNEDPDVIHPIPKEGVELEEECEDPPLKKEQDIK